MVARATLSSSAEVASTPEFGPVAIHQPQHEGVPADKRVAGQARAILTEYRRDAYGSRCPWHVAGLTAAEVASVCSGLSDTPRNNYARNLLNAFLPDGYVEIIPRELHGEFVGLWERFGVTIAETKNGSRA